MDVPIVGDIRLEVGEVKLIKRGDPKYHCCDHCGINFPEVGDSYCSVFPDTHTVPCNEPGCQKGMTQVE